MGPVRGKAVGMHRRHQRPASPGRAAEVADEMGVGRSWGENSTGRHPAKSNGGNYLITFSNKITGLDADGPRQMPIRARGAIRAPLLWVFCPRRNRSRDQEGRPSHTELKTGKLKTGKWGQSTPACSCFGSGVVPAGAIASTSPGSGDFGAGGFHVVVRRTRGGVVQGGVMRNKTVCSDGRNSVGVGRSSSYPAPRFFLMALSFWKAGLAV